MAKMRRYFYEAVLTPCGDGRYDARFPELDVITFGDDLADAAFMAQDLLATVISSRLADGEEVPMVGRFDHDCPEGSLLMGIATYAMAELMLDDTMTVQEAADLLGVSRPRIYALIDSGVLRSQKVGNQRVVAAKDVIERFNNPRPAGRPSREVAAA